MSMTERGIYITLMAMCWEYGSITWEKKSLAKRLGIDPRTVESFMERFWNLSVNIHGGSMRVPDTLHEGSRERVFIKLQEFAERLGKNEGISGNFHTEERREEKKRTDKKVSVVSRVSVRDQNQDILPFQEGVIPFDAASYAQPVTSKKTGTVYSAEQTRRVLDYHFKHSDNPFWKTIDSLSRLESAIHTMAQQVPTDWTPPVAKPKRVKGNPDCRKCWGEGIVTVRSTDDELTMSARACECVPQSVTVN